MSKLITGFNVRVEFEPRQIRHISVQCPFCYNWFMGEEITHDDLSHDYDIDIAEFKCPLCEKQFNSKYGSLNRAVVREVGYPEVYDNCLRQVVKTVTTWEHEEE